MRKSNHDLRQAIKRAGLSQYHVAHCMNMNDSQFSIMLRFELNSDEKTLVYAAIEQAKEKFKGE